jgi:trimeric autotransporter adhesin
MNPLTQSKNATILPVLIALTLGCFALSPQARAVCQEGCDTSTAATFLGEDALVNNNGTSNTAIGAFALTSNTSGAANTATGSVALFVNTSGSGNTATGVWALRANTTGNFNTATGQNALLENTIGGYNAAIGYNALDANTTGNLNTAIGVGALGGNTIGSNNIALGFGAGARLATGNHNIYIGDAGSGGGESGKIRIGTVGMQNRTFIAGISGNNVPDGVGVIVGSDGRLGTVVSSARFKEAIKPMAKASEAILALKPVTFHYKHDLDPQGVPQFGLVAEEVEKVSPDLVARDADGKAYTVRYEAVNAMLLNEFLKEHRKVEDQQATITELKSTVAQQKKDFQATVAQLTARLDEQASQIKKVNAQLETNKAAPQIVLNNQ